MTLNRTMASLAQLTLLLGALTTAAGCRGRDRRPIAVQAPPTTTGAPTAGQQQATNPGAAAGTPGVDPLQQAGNGTAQGGPVNPTNNPSALPGDTVQPGATAGATTGATATTTAGGAANPTAGATGGLPSGGNGTQPGPPAATMSIATTLEDGTQASLQWDGKSFKGNDKWDVVSQ